MSPTTTHPPQLTMDVLQQFRIIYGSMRQRLPRDRRSLRTFELQMWVLQEVKPENRRNRACRTHRDPSIHLQSAHRETGYPKGFLSKTRQHADLRRVGLCLAPEGLKAIAALPGPAEGTLPEALNSIPDVVLKTLNINLSELIRHLPGRDDSFANVPLADIVRQHIRETDQQHAHQ